MTIQRFEELEILLIARKLSKKIRLVAMTTKLCYDFSLKDQIFASNGFVLDNITEGYERDRKKEFMQFLNISIGSPGETRSLVHRIFDSGYTTEVRYQELLSDCLNLGAQISNLINYLYKADIPGKKQSRNNNKNHPPESNQPL